MCTSSQQADCVWQAIKLTATMLAGLSTSSLGREHEQQQSALSSSTPAAPINLALPRDRKTQVLLPSETDAQVSQWLSFAH